MNSFLKVMCFWETAHLPLPKANISTYFSLRPKCWRRGGVGWHFPEGHRLSIFPCFARDTNKRILEPAWKLLPREEGDARDGDVSKGTGSPSFSLGIKEWADYESERENCHPRGSDTRREERKLTRTRILSLKKMRDYSKSTVFKCKLFPCLIVLSCHVRIFELDLICWVFFVWNLSIKAHQEENIRLVPLTLSVLMTTMTVMWAVYHLRDRTDPEALEPTTKLLNPET